MLVIGPVSPRDDQATSTPLILKSHATPDVPVAT
jgi:hypothetical protein